MTTIVENSANQMSLKKSWFTILLLRCQWAHQADGLWSVHWVPLDPQQQVLPEQRQDSQRWDQYWWNPLTIRIRAKKMVDWCPFFRPQPTGLNGPWESGPGFWSVFLSLFVDPWDEAVGKKEKEGTPTLSCTFSRWNSKLHRAGGEMAFQISSVHFTIFSYIALHLWSMSLLSNVVTC